MQCAPRAVRRAVHAQLARELVVALHQLQRARAVLPHTCHVTTAVRALEDAIRAADAGEARPIVALRARASYCIQNDLLTLQVCPPFGSTALQRAEFQHACDGALRAIADATPLASARALARERASAAARAITDVVPPLQRCACAHHKSKG
jgi:hypothetical protein